MPPLCGENLSWEEGSPAYPTALPWADQLFFIFLTKPFTWGTKKFVSTRMVIRLARSLLFHGKVAFLAAPTFLRITRLRRVNQSMCERSWLGQRGQLFLSNKRWGCLPAFGTGGPYQSSVKKNSTIYLDYYARRVWGQVNLRKGFWDRYWGRAGQLLANFSTVFSHCPRSLCERHSRNEKETEPS